MRRTSSDRLGLAALAAFSLPMVVFQTIELAWRVYLPGFFATTLGLSLGAAGAVLMAARLFDSAVDPLVGWASDRFPTRYGHRRPWLALAAIAGDTSTHAPAASAIRLAYSVPPLLCGLAALGVLGRYANPRERRRPRLRRQALTTS